MCLQKIMGAIDVAMLTFVAWGEGCNSITQITDGCWLVEGDPILHFWEGFESLFCILGKSFNDGLVQP